MPEAPCTMVVAGFIFRSRVCWSQPDFSQLVWKGAKADVRVSVDLVFPSLVSTQNGLNNVIIGLTLDGYWFLYLKFLCNF